jgi:hypothetical protein
MRNLYPPRGGTGESSPRDTVPQRMSTSALSAVAYRHCYEAEDKGKAGVCRCRWCDVQMV